jgi:hypothetical protein
MRFADRRDEPGAPRQAVGAARITVPAITDVWRRHVRSRPLPAHSQTHGLASSSSYNNAANYYYFHLYLIKLKTGIVTLMIIK